MRVRIERQFSLRTPFQLCLPGTTIDVWSSGTRLNWTWIDRTSASMCIPALYRNVVHCNLVAGKYEVSSGRVTYRHFRIAAIANIQWKCGDELLIDEPDCCGGTIRQQDRRRLAVWRKRCGMRVGGEVVIRNDLPGGLQCIAMGLAIYHTVDEQ